MSKPLNFAASEFVPRFKVPGQTAPPAPLERPEQTEAPPPPPTITLNIGGSKSAQPPAPAPAAASRDDGEAPAKSEATPPSSAGKVAAAAKSSAAAAAAAAAAGGSKTFSMDRAKTDASQIHQHVKEAVDEDTLKDLYGERMSLWNLWA